jgi:hypothetical protein
VSRRARAREPGVAALFRCDGHLAAPAVRAEDFVSGGFGTSWTSATVNESPGVVSAGVLSCAFLISLKAGGAGLNLTAANYVVLFDPWWNPAVEAQAIDRAHRIGQTRTVIAYRMLAAGTIEEKIWELQQRKAALVADVLGEDGFARALTPQDLDYLLG